MKYSIYVLYVEATIHFVFPSESASNSLSCSGLYLCLERDLERLRRERERERECLRLSSFLSAKTVKEVIHLHGRKHNAHQGV